jgi:hypothetical protein
MVIDSITARGHTIPNPVPNVSIEGVSLEGLAALGNTRFCRTSAKKKRERALGG